MPELPAPGSEIVLAVKQVANRPIVFAEQAVIGTVGGQVEIIFLRTELSLTVQKGVVREVDGGGLQVDVTEVPLTPEFSDVGHARLSPENATNLAAALVTHLQQNHKLSLETFLRRLTEVK